jgi:hypothetical protein
VSPASGLETEVCLNPFMVDLQIFQGCFLALKPLLTDLVSPEFAAQLRCEPRHPHGILDLVNFL